MTRSYRIILGDPEAEPDPLSTHEVKLSTLALADAEAARVRVTEAEAAHLAKMTEKLLRKGRRTLKELAELDLDDIETPDFLIGRRGFAQERKGLRLLRATSPNRPAALHAARRRLARYRREAEARRRKALKVWSQVLETQKAENGTNFWKALRFLIKME